MSANGSAWKIAGICVGVILALVGVIWGLQLSQIDSVRDTVAAVEADQKADHDTIADVQKDIAVIKDRQEQTAKSVEKIEDKIDDMDKKLDRILQRTNP